MKWWAGLTALVLLVILMVGLKPGDISPANHAEWLGDKPGLRFGKFGIAYTDPVSDLLQTGIPSGQTFSIEIALRAKRFSEDGFQFVFLVHGGKDEEQLLIGQWGPSLIVMNGDDYDHRRKTDRITATSATATPQPVFLTLTAGSDGTAIYLDGQQAAVKKKMHLKMPETGSTRLLVGNSVYGKHFWEGEIYGIAIYGKTLSKEEVAAHYAGWSKNSDFSFAREGDPVILYNLDNEGTNGGTGHIEDVHSLHVPSRLKVLTPSFLYQKLNFRRIGRSLYRDRDAVINFFGFIPLGVMLGATLIKRGGRFKARSISISLAAGFLVSLWIETVQAWMPARSSDLQDLILNTAGAVVGALCCRYLLKGLGKKDLS